MRPAAVPAALFGLALALLATVPLPAAADTAKALFGAVDRPSPHDPNPIGRNAQGCLAGGVALPESGPTWQEMRLSRNHYWGDPSLIDFIARYTAQARKVGWQGLYIGDLSQPRGGPVGGHASHQTGLDVDIWLTPATRLDLTPAERETISAISVLGRDKRSLNRNWGPAQAYLLEAAARDPQVERIFITAPAKLALCAAADRSDAAWLRKIRPWWGHDDHLHVRLNCPAGAPGCVQPDPLPPGDGCREAVWWVTEALEPPDPNAPAPKPRPPLQLSDLPRQCADVLQAR